MADKGLMEIAATMMISITAGLISTAIITYINDKVTRPGSADGIHSLDFYKNLY